MDENVIYEKKGEIAEIILNKPEKANSLDLSTLNQLIEAYEQSAENEDLCVIYRAKGKHFTVGADLKYGHKLLTDETMMDEAVEFLESWQIFTRKMLAHPGIIIVGYHGWVIGGGFEHTLGCDLRFAADNTRIMLPELGVGLFFSNASTKLLPRIIGEGRAKELMLLGEEISAQRAYEIGLVNKVCKPSGLYRLLKKTANKIVQSGHLALRYTKSYINENQDMNIEGVLTRESLAMIMTGRSEEIKKRLNRFAHR